MKNLFLKLLIIITIIFGLTACSKKLKEKQVINFKLSKITSGISVTGGTYVKMVSGTNSKLVKLDGTDSTVIDYGTWDFYVVAFEGPGPLGGNYYCGTVKDFVVDSAPTLPKLTVNMDNCNYDPFFDVVGEIYNSLGAPFVSVWRTSTPAEVVTLPLATGETYNFTVDWGDGSLPQTVVSDTDPNKTHTYADPGDYVIVIFGTMTGINTAYGTMKNQIIDVVDLGNMGWTNLSSAFKDCTLLTTFSGGDTSLVTNMSNMFDNTPALTNIYLDTFNTTNVTNMNAMFQSTGANSLNLYTFNTSNVTDMGSMFQTATNLTYVNVSSFNTSNVYWMSAMFNGASSIADLDVSNFTNENVQDMGNMFSNMYALQSLNLTGFGTPNVNLMNAMFLNSNQLSNINVSSFDTTNVTNMAYMFYNTGIGLIDVSNFNTISVSDMSFMFAENQFLTDLDLSTFNVNNIESTTGMESMFENTSVLNSLNAMGWADMSANTSANVFNGSSLANPTCDQGGTPASGSLFGLSCI